MSSKKEGQKGLCRGGPAGRREVKPGVALDYDTIGGAGGLASGGSSLFAGRRSLFRSWWRAR